MENDIKLNLGSGETNLGGYINVDIRPVANICMDMREYVKTVENSSIERILLSHSLEHIPKTDAEILLQECHRIMKLGGILEIICPDAKWAMRKYLAEEIDWAHCQHWLHSLWRDESDRHLWISDDTSLLPMITQAGFKNLQVYTGDGNIAVHSTKT